MNACLSFPRQLLLLVFRDPLIVDPRRASVSAELLNSVDIPAASACGTFRVMFCTELHCMSSTGKCPQKLWRMLKDVVNKVWYASTQVVEGCNSTIKMIGKNAPNITFAAMSSRTTIKQNTNVEGLHHQQLRTVRQALVDEMVDRHVGSMEAFKGQSESRWALVATSPAEAEAADAALALIPAQPCHARTAPADVFAARFACTFAIALKKGWE